MASAFTQVTTLAIVAVLAVLCLGLWNMMRNGTPSFSQTLMRWRVGLQFLAILMIMVTVFLKRA